MEKTRSEFQIPSVYIKNAYSDVLLNLQEAMSKYKAFTETGEYDSLIGIAERLDEAMLAMSDLAMAVNSDLPDISTLSAAQIEELTSESGIPF